jgi:hypothetical protein
MHIPISIYLLNYNNCIVFENFTASIVDLMGKFHKNRNNSTVFEELSVSIVDLMVANIRFTGSVSRRQ